MSIYLIFISFISTYQLSSGIAKIIQEKRTKTIIIVKVWWRAGQIQCWCFKFISWLPADAAKKRRFQAL